MSNFISPDSGLTIQILDRGEVASCEERVTQVLNSSFDAALLIASGRSARAGGKVVVAAKLEQTRVKLDQVAAAIENDRAHIIVEHGSDDAAPIRESMDVALNETLESLVKGRTRPKVRGCMRES